METFLSSTSLAQTFKETDASLICWTVIAVLLFSCIVTRIMSGFQTYSIPQDQKATRPVRKVPYWFPWIGHIHSFVIGGQQFFAKKGKAIKEPVYSLYMGGTTQNIVLSPSMTTAVFAHRDISNKSFINLAMRRIFGDRGPICNLSAQNFKTVHNHLNLFLREPWLTDLSSKTTRLIERDTPHLVSFCRSLVDQSTWERPSNVSVVHGRQCEADLFALTRNFAGHIVIAAMVGQPSLDLYPNMIQDFWAFDAHIETLGFGMPSWLPIPGLSAALAARERLTGSVEALFNTHAALEEGRDPGIEFRDLLDDVCEPIKRRISSFREAGYSARNYAPGDLAVIWAMVTNTPTMVFWTLLHILADATLRSEIEKEIVPYIKVSRKGEVGSPFTEPPRLSIDLRGLVDSCILLKATYYETLRVDVENLTIRQLPADVTLTESPAEAALDGIEEPRSYTLRKGEYLMIPFTPQHQDHQYFPDPSTFNPHRFISVNSETGKKELQIGTLRPFGGGASMCKGRVLAESEILAFTAAILCLWDIQPVAEGGGWQIPAHRQGTGALSPKRDLRVRVKYRE